MKSKIIRMVLKYALFILIGISIPVFYSQDALASHAAAIQAG